MGMLLVMSFILLTQIIFSSEKDHAISSCCRTQQGPMSLTFNCSHCSLTTIPSGIPRNVTVLDLSNNNIKTITGPSLPFTQLRSLHLRGNQIHYISNTAFVGIRNLTLLDVSHNNFNNTVGFPKKLIPRLHNLFSLHVDVYRDFNFDGSFLSLQKLTILQLNPASSHLNLRNTTFEGLNNCKIRYLYIKKEIRVFETGVFINFPHLKGLTVTGSTLKIDLLLRSLYGLQNSKIEYIDFSWNWKKYIPVTLDNDDGIYLRNICLKYINVKRTHIVGVKPGFISLVNDCIETLIVSENALSYYPLLSFLTSYLVKWKNLKYFDASWGGHSLPLLHRRNPELDEAKVYPRRDLTYNISIQNFPNIFFVTTKFHFLNLSFVPFAASLPNITVHAAGLNVIDFAFVGKLHCRYGKISGLKNLTILNISGIDCSEPHRNMLNDMINLTYFVARKCQLSSNRIGQDFFKGLKFLKYIDLADNMFSKFDVSLEDQIQTLESLILRNTNSTRIPSGAIKNMKSLKLLDLQNNKISLIGENDRNILDSLKNRERAFTILLDNNPLLCSCGGEILRFLYWLHTNDIIANKDRLICLSNGDTKKLIHVLNSLESFKLLQYLIPAAGISILAFLLIFAIIRSKYKLKYWLITTKMRLFGGWEPMEDEHFDVYVSFHEDCIWTKDCLLEKLQNINNLKISTGPKPGFPIRDGIIRAIESSEKTIIVLTNDYLEDEWGKFALNMALIHANHNGDIERFIAIFQEEIKPQNMPDNLKQVVWLITNLKWPLVNEFKNERSFQKKRLQFWRDLFNCFDAVYNDQED